MKDNHEMDKHREAVERIAVEVRGFYGRKESFRIYHGATNSTRLSKREIGQIVDTSDLKNVLEVDKKARTAVVEPNVPMDQLIECTMKHGLIPPVVMEFPGITVGGGFAGSAGESSSFRYGLFDSLIMQIEIILASGEVVTASETERPDLRHGAAGSYGTLGVVTCLQMQLVEAKTYVELTYFPFKNLEDAIRMINDQADNMDPSIDYLDGIVFSRSSAVVMSGRLTDRADHGTCIQRFTRAHDQWFYRHVEKLFPRHDGPVTELIPLTDYLFRYDRGGFWCGKYAFQYFMTPFNRITRCALDYFMHSRVMYHALHKSGLANQAIIQDLALPFSHATEFVMYLNTNTPFYPLWLCPVRVTQQAKGQPRRSFYAGKSPGDTLLNIGVWGMGPKDPDKFVDLNRKLEMKVRDLSGVKCLYAHAYYTEEEFWEIYDRDHYDSLRQKYHATSLPTVYDKVKVDMTKKSQEGLSLIQRFLVFFWNIWPFRGIYGVLCAFFGGDYLLRVPDKEVKSIL